MTTTPEPDDTLADRLRAPFPYMGGKSAAVDVVWRALGQPHRYVEPFAGSLAVLLGRPHPPGYEIINDLDGWLVNCWRALQQSPGRVLRHLDTPPTEVDYWARLAWLKSRREGLADWLAGDPVQHDPRAAAWWLYVQSLAIAGGAWDGPWQPTPGPDGPTLAPTAPPTVGITRGIIDLATRRGVSRPHVDWETWFVRLQTRLRHVRICCGDWTRVVTPTVAPPGTAIFLDPPYADTDQDLYRYAEDGVSAQVRQWCRTARERGLRIVLCGYDSEHDELLDHGWQKLESRGSSGGGWSKKIGSSRRERLWFSPACADPTLQPQLV